MSQIELPKPKAYSYVRFSTPEQARGDSARRQMEAASQYAVEHGLELDTELRFTDLGVSAFRSRNVQSGELAAFLRAVHDGVVPEGSYLLVESFDRLSRDDILSAQGLLSQIVGAGITLVTLIDRRAFSKASLIANPTDLILSILTMMRAHEESATKSIRLRAVYDNKRVKIREVGPQAQPFTRRLPAWLRWNDDQSAFELIEERASLIRRVFDWSDAGMGKKLIATNLNRAEVKPFGSAAFWHPSYIGKILANPACVGTFVPKTREPKGGAYVRVSHEPVLNYWPAVVEEEQFERVSGRSQTLSARGSHSARNATSVVAGVAKCSSCGSSFIRVNKSPYSYLVCSKGHAKAGCEYLAVPYRAIEMALVAHIDTIVDSAPRGDQVRETEESIFNLEEEAAENQDELRSLLDDYRRTRSVAFRDRIVSKEAELEAQRVELLRLRSERNRLSSPYVVNRLEALRKALHLVPLDVPAANKALRECVRSLSIDPKMGRMDFQWHHVDASHETVPFASRHQVSAFRGLSLED